MFRVLHHLKVLIFKLVMIENMFSNLVGWFVAFSHLARGSLSEMLGHQIIPKRFFFGKGAVLPLHTKSFVGWLLLPSKGAVKTHYFWVSQRSSTFHANFLMEVPTEHLPIGYDFSSGQLSFFRQNTSFFKTWEHLGCVGPNFFLLTFALHRSSIYQPDPSAPYLSTFFVEPNPAQKGIFSWGRRAFCNFHQI